MIDLRDVALRVGTRTLLTGLQARIDSSEFVAVLGPNGAGKTTLLRAIAGLHPVHAGTIAIDGSPTTLLSPSARARRIAFVTGDDVMLDALAVGDVVAIGRFPHHRWWEWRMRDADALAVADSLAAVGMSDFERRLFFTLSAGERQRIWIALGLAQATPILLLDEPTNHLDIRAAHDVLALLRRLASAGKTILCSLHDVNEAAAHADRIGLLANGTLVGPAEPNMILNDSVLDRTYGIALERISLPDGALRIFTKNEASAADARPNPVPNA